MFAAERWILSVSVILVSGLPLATAGDDSKPNPAAVPINCDNDRHRQFLKVVAKGSGDVVFRPRKVEFLGWMERRDLNVKPCSGSNAN